MIYNFVDGHKAYKGETTPVDVEIGAYYVSVKLQDGQEVLIDYFRRQFKISLSNEGPEKEDELLATFYPRLGSWNNPPLKKDQQGPDNNIRKEVNMEPKTAAEEKMAHVQEAVACDLDYVLSDIHDDEYSCDDDCKPRMTMSLIVAAKAVRLLTHEQLKQVVGEAVAEYTHELYG